MPSIYRQLNLIFPKVDKFCKNAQRGALAASDAEPTTSQGTLLDQGAEACANKVKHVPMKESTYTRTWK